MKTLINLIRRAIAQSRICSLELQLADVTARMRVARTQEVFLTAYMDRAEAQKELAAARAHYNSLLPIGQRKTWGLA